jgi:hypothetical protein
MIDTMVVDAIADDPEGREAVLEAIGQGRLELLTTHVREDQVATIRAACDAKRGTRRREPSGGAVLGDTRRRSADRSRALESPHPDARWRDVRHFQDSLIADATAARLVTDDRRVARDAYELGNAVWSTAELLHRSPPDIRAGEARRRRPKMTARHRPR